MTFFMTDLTKSNHATGHTHTHTVLLGSFTNTKVLTVCLNEINACRQRWHSWTFWKPVLISWLLNSTLQQQSWWQKTVKQDRWQWPFSLVSTTLLLNIYRPGYMLWNHDSRLNGLKNQTDSLTSTRSVSRNTYSHANTLIEQSVIPATASKQQLNQL